MSGLFWFIAAMFLVAAFGFLLPPLLRKRAPQVAAGQKELTIAVYRDQFAELDNDLKNGVISEDQYAKAKGDIERNLLADVDELERKQRADASKGGKIAAAVVVVVVPALSVGMYLKYGAGEDGLDPAAAVAQMQTPEHQQKNIENMVVQLREKLATNPNDVEGWFMLARTSVFLRRFNDAVDAFEHVIKLGGDKDPTTLAMYADTVAMSANGEMTPKARQAVQQALMLDPFHVQALWLAGTAMYQDKNYKESLKYWERLRQVIPPGSQDEEQIVGNINEMRAALGMPPVEVSAPAAQVKLVGTVRLDPKLAGKAAPDDTVFIFARAAEGPRMPLAIARAKVKDLPYQFVLDDSQAVNPNMRLSTVPQVVVGARVSKSGDAMPHPGDLQGQIGPVATGNPGDLTIKIDQLVP